MGFNERLIEQLNLKIEFLEEEKEQSKKLLNSFKSEIEDLKLEIIDLKFSNWVCQKESYNLKKIIKELLDEKE